MIPEKKNDRTQRPNRVMDLHNGVFASLLSEVLEDEGIPHQLVSYYDNAYAGIFQTQYGLWGHIESPPSYHDRIIQIASDLKTATQQETALDESRITDDT